jgi:hypothetical protein
MQPPAGAQQQLLPFETILELHLLRGMPSTGRNHTRLVANYATDACTCITIAELLSSQLQSLVSSNAYVLQVQTNSQLANFGVVLQLDRPGGLKNAQHMTPGCVLTK